jgi:hypothetical protein
MVQSSVPMSRMQWRLSSFEGAHYCTRISWFGDRVTYLSLYSQTYVVRRKERGFVVSMKPTALHAAAASAPFCRRQCPRGLYSSASGLNLNLARELF